MNNLIRLTDYTASDIYDIFKLTDEVLEGKWNDILKGKSVVLFFRNRVSGQGSHLKKGFIY